MMRSARYKFAQIKLRTFGCQLVLIVLLLINCYSTAHGDFLSALAADNIRLPDDTWDHDAMALKYHDKSKILLIGRESGVIDIWDASKENSKLQIKAHETRADALSFSNDGEFFFSSNHFENVTKLWDSRTGKLLQAISETRGPVINTPNSSIYIIANDKNGGMRLYDSRTKQLLLESYIADGFVTALGSDKYSKSIVVGTASGTIELWKYEENNKVPSLKKLSFANPFSEENWIIGLHFSSNGKSLYVVWREGVIVELDPKSLEVIRAIPKIPRFIHSSGFLTNKDLLFITGTEDSYGADLGIVEIISVKSGKSASYLRNNTMVQVEFLPSLSKLVIARSLSFKAYPIPDLEQHVSLPCLFFIGCN